MAPLLAANVAFLVVFGLFVLAFVGLVVFIAVWAIRRDKAGREAWLEGRDDPEARWPRRCHRRVVDSARARAPAVSA